MNKLKKLLPTSLKKNLKAKWLWISSPVLILDEFVTPGCKFEVKTFAEKQRVLSMGHEEEFLASFLSIIKPENVVYDIGSCVGIYSIHAARLGANVVAFEPDPGYRKRLLRNIKINKLSNRIQVISWAVSDRKGIATLFTDGIKGKSPSLKTYEERGMTQILTDSLDHAVEIGQIHPPDVIKMDIEGAEILALRGMEQILTSNGSPRTLLIEFHPEFLPLFNASLFDCEELLQNYGYETVQETKRQTQIQRIYTLI